MPSFSKVMNVAWDFAKTIVLAGFIAFFCIRGFMFEPFRIPSGSMVPTLLVGDFLFVSKYAYGNRIPMTDWFFWQKDPERGDIAVFKNSHSNMPGSFFGFGVPMFIKRIAAVPGDRISYLNKQIYVNGLPMPLEENGKFTYYGADNMPKEVEKYTENLTGVKHNVLIDSKIKGFIVREMVVPENMFVVVGDNRDNSRDSRFWNYPNWGFVPREDFMGRAEFIFWSHTLEWKPRLERLFRGLRAERD